MLESSLKRLSKHLDSRPNSEGFLRCQRLAQKAIVEVSQLILPGWTEIQAAEMVETYLRDHGVKTFFHKPYAWFGERTRFDGIKGYAAFMPTRRVLRENEPFLLDVAPILDGYIADIGYSDCLGDLSEFWQAIDFLKDLRKRIPSYFSKEASLGQICTDIETEITSRGFENRHRAYPFSVLGHRVHRVTPLSVEANFLNFGWQSFWSLLSRGLIGQLLNSRSNGNPNGLWAIEPHIGSKSFGAKFEEILVVEPAQIRWLEEDGCFCKRRS